MMQPENLISKPDECYADFAVLLCLWHEGKRRAQTHVVRPGETLPQICRQYSVSSEAFLKKNGLPNWYYPYAGQRFEIPAEDEVDQAA